jgi:hypothetical protein
MDQKKFVGAKGIEFSLTPLAYKWYLLYGHQWEHVLLFML